MALATDDRHQYLVGTWTFTDPDRPIDTSLQLLRFGNTPEIVEVSPAANAVYYGAVEPDGRGILLLHNDLHRSSMSRQRFNDDGTLVEVGRWSSGGDGGSYIAFDATGKYFGVANARSGWTIFRNGDVPQQIASMRNEGSGPHPRQAKSHPHCIVFSPDNCWIHATDMGSDEILAFSFDAETGIPGPKKTAYRAPAGSGPRHILWHNGLLYLLNELGNSLTVLRPSEDGMLRALQTVSTLPDTFSGDSHTAHLEVDPNGGYIFASNRGYDSIVSFELDSEGLVRGRRWTATPGKWPWFFTVTPDRHMLVASNLSDSIDVLAINDGGTSEVIGQIAVRRPIFIAQL